MRTFIFVLFFATTTHAAQPELWLYTPVNFQLTNQVDALITRLERAKSLGYSAAVITDYKFGKLDERPDHFWKNLRRTRDAADRIGIELIPCVFPIGYSNSLLQNNPHLAEGMPVRACRMTVRNGKATIADTTNLLSGGAFEKANHRIPLGWDFVDGYGKTSLLDPKTKHSGKTALRMTDFREGNEAGNARVARKVAVKPFHQYEITAWIKTAVLDNPNELHIKALAAGPAPGGHVRHLQHANLGVKRDQDWTRHTVIVNSLDQTELRIYIGLWAGRGGTIWLDDISMKPVAGVNMIRRTGAPLRVVTTGGKQLVEGTDFERWSHPTMGRKPWPGDYEKTHAQPPIVLKPNAPVRDGDTLLVDYYHTATIYDGQATCCLMHPDVFKLLETQATILQRELKPKRWFMQHDEIRLAGWCASCTTDPKVKTVGDTLAANTRRCLNILRKINPEAGVIVWSDMFDPHHNAHANYYLNASTLAGSWHGLDKSTTLANWNAGHAEKSLAFFHGRNHPQIIAGYYDRHNVEQRVTHWRTAAKKSNVQPTAWMYTTWRNNYEHLERFAKAVRDN